MKSDVASPSEGGVFLLSQGNGPFNTLIILANAA